MLLFFDETFRKHETLPDVTFGALCGIAIPESEFREVANDVYRLKLKHFGAEFAADHELKGKELLKNWVFRLEAKGEVSRNLAFSRDLADYIRSKRLRIFGCVCFEKGGQKFAMQDTKLLDRSFRYLFERVDMFMKLEHQRGQAILVFDNRDDGINSRNATAITNFFQRSGVGLALDSILPTPFFAISQAQSVGVQLADFVTTIIGLRFAGHEDIKPYFERLRPAIFRFKNEEGRWTSGLKVIRDQQKSTGRS